MPIFLSFFVSRTFSCFLLYSCLLYCMRSSFATTTKPLHVVLTCDDELTVYVDGRYEPPTNTTEEKLHFYTIDPGKQVLAVRCRNFRSEAGILGSFDNGLVTDTRWKCLGRGRRDRMRRAWSYIDYDDSQWPQAVAYFPNREWTLWGRISDISDQAHWVWTADKGRDEDAYCRRRVSDFSVKLEYSPKGMFQATLDAIDHALFRHIQSQYEVADVTQCAEKCRANSKCLSFNFQHKSKSPTRQCELNKATSGQDPSNYIKRRGYTYYEDIGEG